MRSEPIRGKSGLCCGCGKKVVAKCGNIKLNHWAHTSADKCDSWWENETEWHRQWKSHFPIDTREVTFYDPLLAEYHRADVHNKNGVTIEFQNSPLTREELNSRNEFYNKIVWIVNGKMFKGFQITHNIPDPNCDELQEWYFLNSRKIRLLVSSGGI
ncbi:competence protein CoiA [Acinetobacter sp.]|uniref:competence protein CoiA n=1 Tax=Acinetobacter sp. TaxID=472 RepID=UPI00388DF0ED